MRDRAELGEIATEKTKVSTRPRILCSAFQCYSQELPKLGLEDTIGDELSLLGNLSGGRHFVLMAEEKEEVKVSRWSISMSSEQPVSE